jgi:hypothetical protein
MVLVVSDNALLAKAKQAKAPEFRREGQRQAHGNLIPGNRLLSAARQDASGCT